MDIILLGITVVSLIVALVMSVTAWRLMRDEKQRSAARVAALSVAANEPSFVNRPAGFAAGPAPSAALEQFPDEQVVKPVTRAPWASPSTARPAAVSPVSSIRMPAEFASELPLNQADRSTGGQEDRQSGSQAVRPSVVTHASGFLGATELPRDDGGRQKSLAFAAAILFVVLSGGLVWMM